MNSNQIAPEYRTYPILTVTSTFSKWKSDTADYLITKGVFKYFFNADRNPRADEYSIDPDNATPQTIEHHEETYQRVISELWRLLDPLIQDQVVDYRSGPVAL